ncbi:protein of unknown function [Burkholderia multivorans]
MVRRLWAIKQPDLHVNDQEGAALRLRILHCVSP